MQDDRSKRGPFGSDRRLVARADRSLLGRAVAGFLAMFLVFGWTSFATPAQARSASLRGVTEYRLKVAYLYNFTRYFTWPEEAFEDAKTPFVIGVLGSDPLGSQLDEVARKKTAKGRKIVIRRFESWKDYRPCHILFLPKTVDLETEAEVIARTREVPLLLVGEVPGCARRGAAANFYLDADGTVGFEINVKATAQHRLHADARLLKLAKVVTGSPRPREAE